VNFRVYLARRVSHEKMKMPSPFSLSLRSAVLLVALTGAECSARPLRFEKGSVGFLSVHSLHTQVRARSRRAPRNASVSVSVSLFDGGDREGDGDAYPSGSMQRKETAGESDMSAGDHREEGETFEVEEGYVDGGATGRDERGTFGGETETQGRSRRDAVLESLLGFSSLPLLWSSSSSSFSSGSAAWAASVASDTPLRLDRETTTKLEKLRDDEMTIINLFDQSTPSVVFIDTFVSRRDAFTMDAIEIASGAGSGLVWDDVGHIVTNFHVVEGANSAMITITSPDGKKKQYKAAVTGFDPDKDIAVLKIETEGEKLQPIKLAPSKGVKVGQTALAIGNPFGLDHTLTMGVISGLGRQIVSPSGRRIDDVVQTDAAINPGNSGGALFDISGRLLGMNTAIKSPTGASAGIGFAIPSDTLQQIVQTIIKFGKVVRPRIGVTLLNSAQARVLGISKGVLVLDVPSGSNAEKAGLRGTRRSVNGYIGRSVGLSVCRSVGLSVGL